MSDPSTPAAAECLSAAERRSLRQLAHHLKPIVRLGAGGASEGVISELDRALSDHELVKVKLSGPREDREMQAATLSEALAATPVQQVGGTLTLLRRNPKAKAHLSALRRFGSR